MLQSKINLISLPDSYVGIKANFLEFLFKDYFNFLEYNETQTYDKNNSLFIVNIFKGKEWATKMSNNGYKVVVDNLSEVPTSTPYYQLTNKNWFWYRESLLGIYHGYQNYQPGKSYNKLAFMPVNRVSLDRDKLLVRLEPWLNNFIYSYKEKSLPNDIDKNDNLWQRYFNAEWYDQTYFSLVVESMLEKSNDYTFITEKSFKPIAYKHPYMIYGQAGTLKNLKILGFETYENLFDESYDLIQDKNKRLDVIIENIKNFNQQPYDLITSDKLEHNHHLFFNQNLVVSSIKKEIIEPLLEYAEAK